MVLRLHGLSAASSALLWLGMLVQPAVSLAAETSFCADLQRIIAESRSDLAALAGDDPTADGRFPANFQLHGASVCTVSLPPGTGTYHCVWEFPLQGPAAYAKYDALEEEMRACIGAQAAGEKDQRVNHPDHYDARRFDANGTGLIVSVKDKSALQMTLVNLWVLAAAP